MSKRQLLRASNFRTGKDEKGQDARTSGYRELLSRHNMNPIMAHAEGPIIRFDVEAHPDLSYVGILKTGEVKSRPVLLLRVLNFSDGRQRRTPTVPLEEETVPTSVLLPCSGFCITRPVPRVVKGQRRPASKSPAILDQRIEPRLLANRSPYSSFHFNVVESFISARDSSCIRLKDSSALHRY